MSNHKLTKIKIITRYSSVMKEYFDLMNQSTLIKGLANPNNNLFIGMNVIHRVFEYIIIKTKNIEAAYFYSQKGCYYYFEYLEQINKSEFASSFSHIDAIMIVYNKTIFDIYDGENSNNTTSSTVSNLLSLNNDPMHMTQKELKSLFNSIFKFTRTLFIWDNQNISFQQRIEINDNFLFQYLSHIQNIELINSYIELIQERVKLTYDKYNSILIEIKARVEKMKKKTVTDFNENDFLFSKLNFQRQLAIEAGLNENPKELVKCLFV